MKIHTVKKDALFSIMDLGSLVHSQEDLPKVLFYLVERIGQLMEADACSLFLYDSSTQKLTLKATSGLNPEMVDRIVIKKGEGLTGKTIKILKPISIANAKKSTQNFYVQGLGEEKFTSFLSVPLVYNQDPVGVIVLHKSKATRFKKQDIEFLMSLAIPAVSLIEKAKFMETIGKAARPVEPVQKKAEKSVSYEYLKDHYLKGIAAVPGITMGKLKIVRHQYARRQGEAEDQNIDIEMELLTKAFKYVTEEIQKTKAQAEKKFGPDEASIFEAYLLFLKSTTFQEQIIQEIKRGYPAIKALEIIVGKYMDRMALAQDEYIKERAYDIQDVARKIGDYLLYGDYSRQQNFAADEDTVFLNEFWSISDFVNLDLKHTRGIISPEGGASSHISILADTLNLPAVLGLGSASAQLKDGDFVIVDGFSGGVIVNPTKTTIDIYTHEIEELEKRKKIFQTKKDQKVFWGSGKKPFLIGANLGMVSHIASALESGADDVGLYRTEFPFLIRKTLPTEEDQFQMYKQVVEMMKGREVVFRTLDIGGDKYVSYLNLPRESNPALGWRAIRFSLERKDLFRIQLRALYRASHFGKIKLLLPMITSVEQVTESKEVIESVQKELTEENIKFSKQIPLGVMIEVPAAVEIAGKLAQNVDFFSVGTNDLIQYTLAVDRTNPLVSELYDPFHPAVLKMIARTVQEAHKAKIPIAVCGDMAAQEKLAVILMGLGVDSFSMIPRAIPKIKYLARSLHPNKVIDLARKCLKQESGKNVLSLVNDFFADQNLTSLFHKSQTIILTGTDLT